jgi:hypothetical protein
VVDVVVDGAQRGAQVGWGLRLICGEEGVQDPVVDLGVEDRESEAVGVS